MNRLETLHEIRGYSPYWLSISDLADCGEPDRRDSPGALLLTSTRDAFLTWMENHPEATADDICEGVSEIVQDQVDYRTHGKWQEFVDLCAYEEEPETGPWPSDLDEAADAALNQILERMVFAFARMIEEAEEPEGDDA